MSQTRKIEVNAENLWRLNSPQPKGWAKSARPDAGKDKYYIISVDSHLNPPKEMFRERLDEKWHHKLPRLEVRDGEKFIVQEGMKDTRLVEIPTTGEDLIRGKTGADALDPWASEQDMNLQRITEQKNDGVDGEVVFAGGVALMMFTSTDLEYVKAMSTAWNDWAWEVCGPYSSFCNPAATLVTADIEASIKEVERVAKMGYRILMLPTKPHFGPTDVNKPNYNLPMYDPLWAAIQDHDLAITYHVSTGNDPRGARGNGGAIINYVVHSLAPTIEPIVNMCTSGIFERFPKLRVATIEADAGWVPWMLQKMDEAYKKHHMWVRPKMNHLPSELYVRNCSSSFGEDRAATELAESFGLENNLMWANDYPHHEGSWPHSAEAIERTFDVPMKEETRAKLLGLNAARIFRFDLPKNS